MKGSVHKALRYFLLSTLIIAGFINYLHAQTDSSIINKYAKVRQVYNSDPTDPDSVRVDSAQFFSVLDTVLFIVTKGATVNGPWNFPNDSSNWGKYDNWSDMGRYRT